MPDNLKSKVLSGLLWRGLDRFGTQGMSFVVSIILARLLEPKDFGTISLVTVFIALASCFVNGGFGTALVQGSKVTERDYCSVFYLSLAVAVGLYGAIFMGAPWVASFYREPVLTKVLRVLAVTLVFGALNTVQHAVLHREMQFKRAFKISLISTSVSGAVGVSLAYMGYGVWALALSSLVAQAVSTIALWFIIAWRPQPLFAFAAVRDLFRYSSKILASGLLDTLFNNLYNVIIGKLFNPTVLGYYARGQSMPNVAMSGIQGTVDSVIFPALATCQHDKVRVREIVRRAIKSVCFLIFPMMFGLAAVARPLVLVLLTEKWEPCVHYLQISCITASFWPLHAANLQAVKALGRSDIFLTLEVIKKSLIVVMIIGTYRFGVMAMVVGQAVCGLICVAINAWPNRRLINYPLIQQTADILPAFLLSLAMGLLVWALRWDGAQLHLLLIVKIALGLLIYGLGAKLLHFESANYLWCTAKQVIASRSARRI